MFIPWLDYLIKNIVQTFLTKHPKDVIAEVF